ncbi:unnamed protein product [Spirodela intermedia]|uniref:Uncharacterized protein n=2 Tax=Spirodela intermedia TaxID=51605 RepID=A0A7I8KFF4_SPIIN|nr:unnamed protein product [Spirodela intermedia]CAA6660110.1 unnamed protein product [Spirodela intermedia]CAA7396423.1 unnamed protein product [Spirodela intermedia]
MAAPPLTVELDEF